MGWIVQGTQTHGDHKGEVIRAVCESHDLRTAAEARLFGAGQLRGMGYVVEDVHVEPSDPKDKGSANQVEWMRQYLIERYPHLRPKRIHWDTIALIVGCLFVVACFVYIGTLGL